MDKVDVETLFVNEFVNKLEDMRRRGRQAHEFYLYGHNRPRNVEETIKFEAEQYAEYVRLFKV